VSLKTRKRSLDEIAEIVCYVTQVEKAQLIGKRFDTEIVKARQLFCWFAYYLGLVSSTKIGKYLNHMDHTTVLYSKRKVEDLVSIGDIEYTVLFNTIKKAMSYEQPKTKISQS